MQISKKKRSVVSVFGGPLVARFFQGAGFFSVRLCVRRAPHGNDALLRRRTCGKWVMIHTDDEDTTLCLLVKFFRGPLWPLFFAQRTPSIQRKTSRNSRPRIVPYDLRGFPIPGKI